MRVKHSAIAQLNKLEATNTMNTNDREQLNTAITRARYGERVSRELAPTYFPHGAAEIVDPSRSVVADWHSDEFWPILLRELLGAGVGLGWSCSSNPAEVELACCTGERGHEFILVSGDLAECVCKAWLQWKERQS
jgi:hypothetical protein